MDASDFSFFDDELQVEDKLSSNSSEKESRKRSDSDHWDLHGTNNITNQVMKSSDGSDSDDSIDEVVQSPTTTSTSSSRHKDGYHSPVILSSTDEDDDTLTDVSPQSSPETSPRMKRSFRYSFSEDEKEHGGSKISKNNSESKSEDDEVKHITKLNVTFKQADTSDKITHKKNKLQKTKSHKNRVNGRFSLDHVEGSLNRYFKKGSSEQDTEHVSSCSNEKEAMKKEENKEIDLNHLLEIILDLEEKGINVKEKYKEQSSQRRANHNRRNMSFSNNQLREIEMENHRLFKELSRKTPRSRPSSAASTSTARSRFSVRSSAGSRASTASSSRRSRNQSATPKLYHSAVNRANIQRQIERENMQILKRLQSAKATPGLQRSKQLRDYHQQTKYMGSSLPVRPKRHFAQLSRDPDIIQQALDIGEPHFGNLRPNWQDVW